jgi:hypothetical protein
LVCAFLLWRFLGSMAEIRLLTDPFLQLPTENSVRVVWFTEFAGDRHEVEYGERFERTVWANTTTLSRVREDAESYVDTQSGDGTLYPKPTYRQIWRHEAQIEGLSPGDRLPYRVYSRREDGRSVMSEPFTLASAPLSNTPLKILLTSDHQLKSMTPANLQKVAETVGAVDAVFFAGDLVDVPDRASEWFDDNRGNAFFPCLQGRSTYALDQELNQQNGTTTYTGGALIQSAPLFPAVGNHEVMGQFSMEKPLGEQFNAPLPRSVAERAYTEIAPQLTAKNTPSFQQWWIKDHSFNTDTYEEIFSLPTDSPGGKKYYAITFGNIRLISLFVTNIWRTPNLDPGAKGRYRERDGDLNDPMQWGYGQHIFESIAPGSPQYTWLQAELNRPEFQQATYKIVMFHHPPHSLGDNVVPAYTDPVQIIDRFGEEQILSVRYEYPIDADYLIRDVMPLLESAGVQLVFYGHSHLWNRFVSPGGMHFLESSNVGNTYGAYTFTNQQRRPIPVGFQETYRAMGDPNGLEPIVPTLHPLFDENGQPQPYIASNDITVFSVLDTATGTVNSYRYDTQTPNAQVIQFDQFQLP